MPNSVPNPVPNPASTPVPSRRELLTRTPLLALVPSVPVFLLRGARASQGDTAGRILVVLELHGGNDGLNTVVPLHDDEYRRLRPTLALGADEVLAVDGEVGLHPSLAGLAALLERGQLAIVQGVGVPHPSRSHDVSLATWHTARFGRDEHKGFGWLGRALDEAPRPRRGVPSAVLAGSDPLPGALFARRAVTATVDTLDEYASADLEAFPARTGSAADMDSTETDPAAADPDAEAFVRRTALEARATAERLRELAGRAGVCAPSAGTELARRLDLVLQMIRAGLETPVYYVVQHGYDTHELQALPHARLLSELAGAVHGFFDALLADGLAERVLLLTTSEFGRRVGENASAGTDHGTAAPLFLAGPGVVPGVHGARPALDHLEDGDPPCTLDFRCVYASVLQRWLGVDPVRVLEGDFEPLALVRG